MDQKSYQNHLAVLKSELIVALGRTEPIAIVFATVEARETLGQMPEHCVIRCSGDIIRNVKGVVVPKSQGMRGMEAAAALGIVGGDTSQELTVLESVKDEDVETMCRLLAQDFYTCELTEGMENLYILTPVNAESHSAKVEIKDYHNNITEVVKGGAMLYSKDERSETKNVKKDDRTLLNLKNILESADYVRMEDIEETIGRQITYSTAISEEGLRNPWGAQVGRTLMENNRERDIEMVVAAATTTGSDARINDCSLPVVISSGSGNQGITIMMPVVAYARRYRIPKEKIYAILCVANLVNIHQKKYIDNFSAYCDVVSAAAGTACGIAYMNGASYDEINQTITNMVCTAGGIACDGTKSNCVAKIAASVTAAFTGWQMASKQHVFQPGEGLVEENVEDTVANAGRMEWEGMRSIDVEILNMMLGN